MCVKCGISDHLPCNCHTQKEFCTTCYRDVACDIKINAACVIYHLYDDTPSKLTCLGIPNKVNIEAILEEIDERICNLEPGGQFTCESVNDVFITDANQNNQVNQLNYDFLSTGTQGCFKISPPTSFAVGGASRKSAFGRMEWFATLTLANASAVSGETVLLYTDSSEIIVVKTGVNYHGITQSSVGGISMISGQNSNFTINNITSLGNVSFAGSSNIFTNNFIVNGNLVLQEDVKLYNGLQIGTSTNSINLLNNSLLDNFSTNCIVYINDSAIVNKLTCIHTSGDNTGAAVNMITYQATTSSIVYTPTLTNSYVYSKNKAAINIIDAYSHDGIANSSPIVTNNVGISDSSIGIQILSPDTAISGSNLIANNTGMSSAGPGIVIVGTVFLTTGPVNNYKYLHNQSNMNGYSPIDYGIHSLSCTIENCTGTSIISPGIRVDGGEAYNTKTINCRGESYNSVGLDVYGNCHIINGVYTSNLDSKLGNPIRINFPRSYFYIVGATTIARNITAYAIAANSIISQPIRISGCQFLNTKTTSGILGIDTTGSTYTGSTISLRAVTQDSHFNTLS